MTEIAYMIREDWAQEGEAMVSQSAVIREWLGPSPYVFVAPDLKRIAEPNSADMEFVDFIAAAPDRHIIGMGDLRKLSRHGKRFEGTVTVVHPYKQEDCELLLELVNEDLIARLFVIVWAPMNMVKLWLEGTGALNLSAGKAGVVLDPVQVEAAKCMVNEQYNGLSTGDGKASVVQLIRVFTEDGYSLQKEAWLRAYFAAGGKFAHAPAIEKLISEMNQGVNHRVKQRYRPEILSVLRERAAAL